MTTNHTVPGHRGLHFWLALIIGRLAASWQLLTAPVSAEAVISPRVGKPAVSAMDLTELDRFVRLMLQLNAIIRRASVPFREQWESVAEHSFAVALAGLYLIRAHPELYEDVDELDYVVTLLVHDLPEAFAGDAQWDDDPVAKDAAELTAFKRILADYQVPWIEQLLHNYIYRIGPTANRARADEKLIASWVIFCSGGVSWRATGQTLAKTKEVLRAKISLTTPTQATLDLMEKMFTIFSMHPEVFAPEEG